ncbi:hypothetical protein DL96DRAFT_1607609 [Flagelloscypha sp. PMI_526]|nr:hypothetical protein DL96DRAFT_1607609 [Flagelloscypha sp. PMI_526]
MNREHDRKPFSPLQLELPWDVLSSIFQKIAWVHRPTALTLTLVSKEVQHVIDQVLFKHIAVSGNQRHRATLMLNDMFVSRKLISPRLLLARTFISSVFSDREIGWKLLFAIISGCPNLNSLSAGLTHPQLFTLSSSTLRRLTYRCIPGTASTYPPPESLCQPLFQTVTHLDFAGSLTTLKDMEDVWPRALFKLTHLRIFVGFDLEDMGNLFGILSAFVRSLPTHLKIIILYLSTPPDARDISASPLYKEIQTGELDDRVILAESDPAGKTWLNAEVVVACRRASSLRAIRVWK